MKDLTSQEYNNRYESFYAARLLQLKRQEQERLKRNQEKFDQEVKREIKIQETEEKKGFIKKLFGGLDKVSQWSKGEFGFIKKLEQQRKTDNLASQVKSSSCFVVDGAMTATAEDEFEDEGMRQEYWQQVKKQIKGQAKRIQQARRKAQAVQRAAKAVKMAKTIKSAKSALMVVKGITAASIIGIIVTIIIWFVQLIGHYILGIKWIPPLALWEWPLVILVGLIVGFLVYVIMVIIAFVVKMTIHPFDAIAELGKAVGSLVMMFVKALL